MGSHTDRSNEHSVFGVVQDGLYGRLRSLPQEQEECRPGVLDVSTALKRHSGDSG